MANGASKLLSVSTGELHQAEQFGRRDDLDIGHGRFSWPVLLSGQIPVDSNGQGGAAWTIEIAAQGEDLLGLSDQRVQR